MLDFGIGLNVWPWIWMATAMVLALVEMRVVRGNFLVLPWAGSAFLAGILGFFHASVDSQWVVFLLGGTVLFAMLRRWSRRFAASAQANRVASTPAKPQPSRDAHRPRKTSK